MTKLYTGHPNILNYFSLIPRKPKLCYKIIFKLITISNFGSYLYLKTLEDQTMDYVNLKSKFKRTIFINMEIKVDLIQNITYKINKFLLGILTMKYYIEKMLNFQKILNYLK